MKTSTETPSANKYIQLQLRKIYDIFEQVGDSIWNTLREWLVKKNSREGREGRMKWMTREIVNLMKERERESR